MKPPVPVVPAAPEQEARARELAARWGLAFALNPSSGFVLEVGGERVQLRQCDDPRQGPIWVDLVGGAVGHRRRFGGGRGQPLAKAIGLKGGRSPTVLDATAGLGRDAFVLAALGCEVTLVERSPVAALLLEDGLRRAAEDADVRVIAERMHLVHKDAPAYMRELSPPERPEVVYLDPMYPKKERHAKVKKEMQAFQAVIGADEDADRLLTAALTVARERVVVKRPDFAAPLANIQPTLSFPTRSHRFDVYVIRAM